MEYLLIENKGEIIPEALFLMGASSKRDDDTKIGFFGSGNKYALALLLRLKIPFRIFTGEQEVKISTRVTYMRDVPFNVIQVNGIDTSLTVEMGPQWEPWFIVREIYCNAIDEGGALATLGVAEDSIRGRANSTRFYIGINEDIKPVCNNWDEYFAFERTDALDTIQPYTGKNITTIYPNLFGDRHLAVYRKGVQVMNSPTRAGYSYDFSHAEIDEMRVMRNISYLNEQGAKAWYQCNNQHLILDMLIAISDGFKSNKFGDTREIIEARFDWGWYKTYMVKEAWRAAIGNRVIINVDQAGHFVAQITQHSLILSTVLCRVINEYFADVTVYGIDSTANKKEYDVVMDPTTKTMYKLNKVVEMIKDIDMPINEEINVVNFTDDNDLARAVDGKILLSVKLLDNSSFRDIIKVLMEEKTHIDTGFPDLSRNLQNYLFDKWLGALEDKHGVFF